MRRLCLGKIFPYWFLCSRALSGAEAVNALRPFYFAVHPDFFGQHPRERVNVYFFIYLGNVQSAFLLNVWSVFLFSLFTFDTI